MPPTSLFSRWASATNEMEWKHIHQHVPIPCTLCLAPKLFNVLTDLLKWIARAQGIYIT